MIAVRARYHLYYSLAMTLKGRVDQLRASPLDKVKRFLNIVIRIVGAKDKVRRIAEEDRYFRLLTVLYLIDGKELSILDECNTVFST